MIYSFTDGKAFAMLGLGDIVSRVYLIIRNNSILHNIIIRVYFYYILKHRKYHYVVAVYTCTCRQKYYQVNSFV